MTYGQPEYLAVVMVSSVTQSSVSRTLELLSKWNLQCEHANSRLILADSGASFPVWAEYKNLAEGLAFLPQNAAADYGLPEIIVHD